jgi:hypothetical protein
MNKEFIPYEEALALKELGFNEPCMAIYYSKDKSFSWHHHIDHTNDEPALDSGEFNISAPLYQQAFRWFREKHNIFAYVDPNYCYKIWVDDEFFEHSVDHDNYEEAELECLKQLIKIVKEKK